MFCMLDAFMNIYVPVQQQILYGFIPLGVHSFIDLEKQLDKIHLTEHTGCIHLWVQIDQ